LQSLFGPKRKIGSITVQVVVNENTNDTLTITKQPVQQGASITDHAYKEPTVFSTTILFKDNNLISGVLSTFSGSGSNGLSKLYQSLLDLQNSRIPFDITTPKRIYRNMLLATLAQTTDKNTENCLAINASFQEVILVKVSTTQVPRIKQKHPGSTGATENAGKKSALLSLKEGIGSLF
jgi:hypothetical protein